MTTSPRNLVCHALATLAKSHRTSFLQKRSERRRRRKHSFGGQRLETLERRELFAGDAFSAAVGFSTDEVPTDSGVETMIVAPQESTNGVEHESNPGLGIDRGSSVARARVPQGALQIEAVDVDVREERLIENRVGGAEVRGDANYVENVDTVFAAAPLDDEPDASPVELPQHLEQIRLEMGDQQFVKWLVQNERQSGNFQNISESQIDEWRTNSPEFLEEFEQVEQALHEWIEQWDPEACVDDAEHCNSGLPDNVEAIRQEIGDEGLVQLLVDNIMIAGNSLGQDLQMIEELRTTNPDMYAEFVSTKTAVDTWLNDSLTDVEATLQATLPEEFDAMRYEMGEVALANVLRQNLKTYGFFQAQSAQGLGAEANEAFAVRGQQLFGFVVNVLLSPDRFPVNADRQVKDTNVKHDGEGKTTTETNYTDGSKTIVEEKDGKTTRTEQNKDNSKTVFETDAQGNKTETDYNKKGDKTERRTYRVGEKKPSVREKFSKKGGQEFQLSRTTYWEGSETPKETIENRQGCEVKTEFNRRGKPVVQEFWGTTEGVRKLKKRIVRSYDANHRPINVKVFECIDGELTLVKETRIEHDVDINFGGKKGTVGKRKTEFERDGDTMRKKREVTNSNDGKKHSVTKFDKQGIGRGTDIDTNTFGSPKPRKFTTDQSGKRYYSGD